MYAAAAAVAAGAGLALTLPIGAGSVAALAVALLSLSVAAPWPVSPPTTRNPDAYMVRSSAVARVVRWPGPALVIAAIGAVSAAHAALVRDAVLAPPLGVWFAARSVAEHGGEMPPVGLRGVVADDAAPLPGGGIRLRLHVDQVEAEQGWLAAPGLVQLTVQGERAVDAFDTWTRGRAVELVATLRWPAVRRNPGSPSPLSQRLARRYVLTGSVKSALLVDVRAGAGWDWGAPGVRRY